ncbi:MAG: RAMP superfamily CRISPR-associated protein, partial [Lachnospirales bacterium]
IREAAENMVDWENRDKAIIYRLFGKGGDKRENSGSLMFSDFTVPETIRAIILKSGMNKEEITDCFTSEYTFTSLTDGVAKKGSLRSCRYINKDMIFYGNIDCDKEDEKFIINCLKAVKYIGSMTTRGFGNVKISVAERRED